MRQQKRPGIRKYYFKIFPRTWYRTAARLRHKDSTFAAVTHQSFAWVGGDYAHKFPLGEKWLGNGPNIRGLLKALETTTAMKRGKISCSCGSDCWASDSSFHGCWLGTVVVWRLLWVQLLRLSTMAGWRSRHFTAVTALGPQEVAFQSRSFVAGCSFMGCLGFPQNTVTGSTVSNTELSEVFGAQWGLGSELSEFLSAYYLSSGGSNSPSFSQNSPSLPQNSVSFPEDPDILKTYA